MILASLKVCGILRCCDLIRLEMYNELNGLNGHGVARVMSECQGPFYVLIRRHPQEIDFETMLILWRISSRYRSKMYRRKTLRAE